MASIFTYDNASRVSSPWSTPSLSTSIPIAEQDSQHRILSRGSSGAGRSSTPLAALGITKLEAEQQEGPMEYKLHLLLRPRRRFSAISTISGSPGVQYTRPTAPTDTSPSLAARPSSVPSTQTRQARLQQLTTQLLWRLQQSSPFHSSSTSDLVLPVLPEATPRLGIPERPAKLLPGLEESQGALYEIGVADDGTLIGLTEDELEESLNNLKAMAASLGCFVDVQRRIVVGHCKWAEDTPDGNSATVQAAQLLVAEALVRPDLHSSHENFASLNPTQSATSEDEPDVSNVKQLRVALVGMTSAGKSSLLGTLTTSGLDNGRGKSRLSLLKHRHEISSGITSSVAQELLGYRPSEDGLKIINYNAKDVTSWSDIHNASSRLTFLSDSPGLPRYSKSCYRSLISWSPHWTIVCVPADQDMHGVITKQHELLSRPHGAADTSDLPSHPSLQYLQLCLKLGLPIVVAITKFDLATRNALRSTLAEILTVLKNSQRKPALITMPPIPDLKPATELSSTVAQVVGQIELTTVFRNLEPLIKDGDTRVVPISFTSSVTGVGLPQLHALLSALPHWIPTFHGGNVESTSNEDYDPVSGPTFLVDEVFAIPPSKVYAEGSIGSSHEGVVLCGRMAVGSVNVGDCLLLGPFNQEMSLDDRRRYGLKHHSISAGSLPTLTTNGRSFSMQALRSGRSDELEPGFTSVKVVSLRNLRLPVRSLLADQVGTIGVVFLRNISPLAYVRKGMVLTTTPGIASCHSFTASFSASDFASMSSPPLILGGHASLYANTIRAAVRVTALSLEDDEDDTESDSPQILFEFEDDHGANNGVSAGTLDGRTQLQNAALESKEQGSEIKITFRFGSGAECLAMGDRVFIVPTASPGAAASSVGANMPSGALGATTGLSGFVGRICSLSS